MIMMDKRGAESAGQTTGRYHTDMADKFTGVDEWLSLPKGTFERDSFSITEKGYGRRVVNRAGVHKRRSGTI